MLLAQGNTQGQAMKIEYKSRAFTRLNIFLINIEGNIFSFIILSF